jgi:hypothetical protein
MNIKKASRKSVFFVVLFILFGSLWVLPTSSEVVCSGNECAPLWGGGKTLNGKHVETFDIRIEVLPKTTQDFISDFRDEGKGIGLSWNQQRQLLITIPMRNGANTTFGYTTPQSATFKSIRIRVIKSDEIYFFIDEKIAYSHRYENAPFFMNPVVPIATPSGEGKVDFTVSHFKVSVESQTNPLPRVGSILFIIGLFGFTTQKILKKVFPFEVQSTKQKTAIEPTYYGLAAISWALTIFVWVRNPIDATGAVNPGPFGPIGAAFSDFFQLSQLAQFDRPYDFGGTNYPPAGLLFLRLITFFDPNDLSLFPLAGIMLGAISFLFMDITRKKTGMLLVLFAFPFVFGVIRGNLDILSISLIWISVLAWKKERYISAGIALAFAIAFKIWPLIFLALYLKKKSHKSLYIALSLTIILTVSASFILGYTQIFEIARISFSALFDQSKIGTYAFQNTFSASALLFIGHIILMSRNPFNITQLEVDNSLGYVNGGYAAMTLLALLILFIYLFFKARSTSVKYLILCGIALSIPTQSFTYRGAVILLFFFLQNQEDQVRPRPKVRATRKLPQENSGTTDLLKKIASWAAIPLFAPVAYYFVPGTQISTGSLLQPLGLLIFIGVMIFEEKKHTKNELSSSSM